MESTALEAMLTTRARMSLAADEKEATRKSSGVSLRSPHYHYSATLSIIILKILKVQRNKSEEVVSVAVERQ